jgi:hypothetical protein
LYRYTSVNQVECGAHFRQEALLEACKVGLYKLIA